VSGDQEEIWEGLVKDFEHVKAYFSPSRDPKENVVGFIDRTRRTLEVAMFVVSDKEIADALIRAASRGVAVRVVMDLEQSKREYDLDDYLKGKVDVRIDPRSGFMHNKYAISDAGMANSAVLTGSFNWSVAATKRNRENLMIVRVRSKRHKLCAVIQQFSDNFEAIWKVGRQV
jgi:phosphatidylserine/phosphatidylglycerophosphate/cardiolipin synthase-like enzyme